MTFILCSTPNDVSVAKILIAGNFVNIKLNVKDIDFSQPDETWKLTNPTSVTPWLEIENGIILEEKLIIDYLLVSEGKGYGFKGRNHFDIVSVDAWIEWSKQIQFISSQLFKEENQEDQQRQLLFSLKKLLEPLNKYLLTRTFLVSNRLSFADISVALNILDIYTELFNEKLRKYFGNVTRWFKTVINQPLVKVVIGPFSFEEGEIVDLEANYFLPSTNLNELLNEKPFYFSEHKSTEKKEIDETSQTQQSDKKELPSTPQRERAFARGLPPKRPNVSPIIDYRVKLAPLFKKVDLFQTGIAHIDDVEFLFVSLFSTPMKDEIHQIDAHSSLKKFFQHDRSTDEKDINYESFVSLYLDILKDREVSTEWKMNANKEVQRLQPTNENKPIPTIPTNPSSTQSVPSTDNIERKGSSSFGRPTLKTTPRTFVGSVMGKKLPQTPPSSSPSSSRGELLEKADKQQSQKLQPSNSSESISGINQTSDICIQSIPFPGASPITITMKPSPGPEKTLIKFNIGKKEKEKWITFEIKHSKNINPDEIKKIFSAKDCVAKKNVFWVEMQSSELVEKLVNEKVMTLYVK